MVKRTIILLGLVGVLCRACGDGGGVVEPDLPAAGDLPAGDVAAVKCRSVADCPMAVSACRAPACSAEGLCLLVADETQNGAPCDPGDRCALEPKTCRSGACEYGLKRACPARSCRLGRCDPATGECVEEAVADGTVCEGDDNICTRDDCRAGGCALGQNECPCTVDEDCPDNVDLCMGRLRCDPGQKRCVPDPQTRVVCPPSIEACRERVCNPTRGECELKPIADGTLCLPTSPCTTGGHCLGGTCLEQPKCRDDNDCTLDVCDPLTGECAFVAQHGAACDDGEPCTTGDVCVGTECVGDPKDCDDGNPCTSETCVLGKGCEVTLLAAGTPCDDGVACTDDACDEDGVCVGTSRACDDDNPCTDDSCDPETGECVHVWNEAPCDDANVCTADDRCGEGVCRPGRLIPGCCRGDADCADDNPCTIDSCILGRCEVAPDSGRSCMATGDGCSRGWCDAETGACRAWDASLPLRLVDWNWLAGQDPKGFVWLGEPGVVEPQGVGPEAGASQAVFWLPRQWVEAGVRVVHLTVGQGTCPMVDLVVNGVPAAGKVCRTVQGRDVASWSWTDDSRLLDVRVYAYEGARVGRLELYAWAHPACRPLNPVRTWTFGTDRPNWLTTASNGNTAVVTAFVPGTAGDGSGRVHAVAADLFGTRRLDWRLIDTFTPYQGRFGGALLAMPDGRFVAAHGGVGPIVELNVIDGTGSPVAGSRLASLVPGTPAGGVADVEPALAWMPWGAIRLVWAFTNLDTLASAIALADGAILSDRPAFPALAEQVSDPLATGRARNPRMCQDDGGWVAAWVEDLPGSPATNRVVLRRQDHPEGPVYAGVLPAQQASIRRLTMACNAATIFLAWEQDGDVLGGQTVHRINMTLGGALTFPAAFKGGASPTLVAGASSAQLIYSSRDIGTFRRVAAAPVGTYGTVGAERALTPTVVLSPAPVTAAPFGPYLYTYAFVSDVGDAGLYQGLTSDACILGNVDCTDPITPRVCTGLAQLGYVAQPQATRWCQ